MSTALTKAEANAREKARQASLEAIDGHKLNMASGVVGIGGELVSIRDNCEPGEFLPWVKKHCRFEKSAAYNYIKCFQEFGKFKRVDHFDYTALYLLCKHGDAAKKAMALATRGNFITLEVAKDLVSQPDEPDEQPEQDDSPSNVVDALSVKPTDDETETDDDAPEEPEVEEPEQAKPERPKEPNLIGECIFTINSLIENELDEQSSPFMRAVIEGVRRKLDEIERDKL